jgi:hypothetical protein
MKSRIAWLFMVAALLVSSRAHAGGWKPLNRLPPALETAAALASLPPALRAGATVYLLDPASGYKRVKEGTNGFACLVGRTEWQWADDRDDLLIPISFDAEGSKTILPVWLEVERLRALGVPPAAVKAKIETGLQSGVYRAPARSGISYMVAPVMRAHVRPGIPDVATMVMPHYMFYAPNVKNEDIGGDLTGMAEAFIYEPGPQGYMVKLVGEAEKSKIVRDGQGLLRDLCRVRADYCVPAGAPVHDHAGRRPARRERP